MSERPILMSDPMVRAILAKQKTQTRRLVKPQPTNRLVRSSDDLQWYDADCINPGKLVVCPYGQTGDRLWVRECFAPMCRVADPQCFCTDAEKVARHYVEYRADTGNPRPGEWPADDADPLAPKWRPSIHMPRWASRLSLPITGVRVERVQAITEVDAKAEGFEPIVFSTDGRGTDVSATARERFEATWVHLYGAASWDANPWVWALEFQKR